MARELMKGNEAIAEAAVRAGLQAYFGYPITPQHGSEPCRSVSQGVGRMFCLPKTAWPPTCETNRVVNPASV